MSNQIMQLEQRLAQREKDLNNSLDQCRLAGKLELARLQGIHDQVWVFPTRRQNQILPY